MGLNKRSRKMGKKRHYSKRRGRNTHHEKRKRKRRTVKRNLGGDRRSDLQEEIRELKELRERCRENLDEQIAQKTQELIATYSPNTHRRATAVRDRIRAEVLAREHERARTERLLALNTLSLAGIP